MHCLHMSGHNCQNYHFRGMVRKETVGWVCAISITSHYQSLNINTVAWTWHGNFHEHPTGTPNNVNTKPCLGQGEDFLLSLYMPYAMPGPMPEHPCFIAASLFCLLGFTEHGNPTICNIQEQKVAGDPWIFLKPRTYLEIHSTCDKLLSKADHHKYIHACQTLTGTRINVSHGPEIP